MNFEQLKQFIEQSKFAKKSFTIEDIYQIMQPLAICPTLEELALLILDSCEKGLLKLPSHQAKTPSKRFMLIWEKKLGVPGTINAIKKCLIEFENHPLLLKEVIKRCPHTYQTTCRCVIYILQTIGIVVQHSDNSTIFWNDEKSEYFLSDDESGFRKRMKYLMKLQLKKKQKCEELARKLAAKETLKMIK